MADHFIDLNCAHCGAKFEVYDDMERFACGYCGNQMIVRRRGGTVVLKAVTEAVKRVQVGTDKTAAELALVRLRHELAELEAKTSNLSQEPPPPVSRGNALAYAIVGVAVGIIFGSVLPWLGIIIAIVVFVLAVIRMDGTRYEEWTNAKEALDVETARVKQDIARQMKIVSPRLP